jgi:hypothetical protein
MQLQHVRQINQSMEKILDQLPTQREREQLLRTSATASSVFIDVRLSLPHAAQPRAKTGAFQRPFIDTVGGEARAGWARVATRSMCCELVGIALALGSYSARDPSKRAATPLNEIQPRPHYDVI